MKLRSRFFAGFFTLSLLVPSGAFARPVSEIVNTQAPTVSRATFLSYAFDAFYLDKTATKDCVLPYTRYPRGLKGTLCAAQSVGALNAFGPQTKRYLLGQPITRGEALIALTSLLVRKAEADVSAFTDVTTDAEKQAVMNAVALKWMDPVSATEFGLKRPLTGREAASMLNAVSAPRASVPTVRINVAPSSEPSAIPKQELLNAVWELLNRDYLRSDKIDAEETGYKQIEALVNSLGDPYTTFFRPAGASDFQSMIKGEISGIGAQIESKSGAVIVVAPLSGSPAEKAGLLPGDEILEANGTVLTGLPLDKAVTFIRGEKGTTVDLKIRRNGNTFTVKVLRDLITIPEIVVKWQSDIAVVQLAQFGEITEKQIRTIFSDINKKSPRGIILDLRNNGGGLLETADTVTSNFVPKGTVVAKVQSRTQTATETTKDEPTLSPDIKVVVLVNKGSASASEIVAGALQDHKRATVVGTQTFGKGTVQEIIGFKSGEALKITIAQWLTPLGRTINDVGVTPDVVVEKGAEKDRDEQLLKALDILR